MHSPCDLIFYPTGHVNVEVLANDLQQPNLELLICVALAEHLDFESRGFNEPICVYPSAVATFYAPSDRCGTGGMRTERIRAVPSWRKGQGRYDCVFIKDSSSPTIPNTVRDFNIARVRSFFSSTYCGVLYSFALVHDFTFIGKKSDNETGMWIVRRPRSPRARVVLLNSIYRAAHLIPVYHAARVPVQKTQTPERCLDDYEFFYVNKFIDHHAFEIAHERA